MVPKKKETLSDIIGRATELPDQSRLLELSQEQNIDWSTHCIGCSWNGSFVTVGQLVGWKEQNSDWQSHSIGWALDNGQPHSLISLQSFERTELNSCKLYFFMHSAGNLRSYSVENSKSKACALKMDVLNNLQSYKCLSRTFYYGYFVSFEMKCTATSMFNQLINLKCQN